MGHLYGHVGPESNSSALRWSFQFIHRCPYNLFATPRQQYPGQYTGQYRKQWYQEEGGYAHILGTRPQTLAYGLNDSPAGLAAWILEKWHAWTNPPGGNLDTHFSRDELLTNVTIYWVTETINSANRFYREGQHTPWPKPGDHVRVSLGVALTATQRFERPPREYVERLYPDIRYWVELPRGGHFVALEEPEFVAASIRAFFRLLRQ
jgi:pimeloyl-ACP methyl ester carboxylesterase